MYIGGMHDDPTPRVGVGTSLPRVEDRSLLTGHANFSADVPVDGALQATFVRSTVPHAKLTVLDTAEARSSPGVEAVFTTSDLKLGQVFMPGMDRMLGDHWHRPALARDEVRFAGEAVTVVIADTLAHALDAAELVDIDYEPLPHVIEPLEAARPGSPRAHSGTDSNVAVEDHIVVGERALSDITVSARMTNPRMAVAPLEGNSITVDPLPGGSFIVWAATQLPHALRDGLAAHNNLDPAQVRVIATSVGGGFGGKTATDPDYVTIFAAAVRIGRSVRWVQPRNENLLNMHARGQTFDVTLSARRDGRVSALTVDAVADVGAYPGVGVGIAFTTRRHAPGQYQIPHLEYRVRCVATNTAPVGAFRGAGRPEATGMIERSMDLLAQRLDIDPVEIRRRNLVATDQFPHDNLVGSIYDTGDYLAPLERAVELIDYHSLRSQQRDRRARCERLQLGIGIASFVEMSATVPGFHVDRASLEVSIDGRFEVRPGTASHGQGHHTIYAQIVSEVLGVHPSLVSVVDSDTDAVPSGSGTGGSRSAQIGGSAVLAAAQTVLHRAKAIAAEILHATPDDIIPAEDGSGLQARGVRSAHVTWISLAAAALNADRPLRAAPGFKQTLDGTAPFGCHIAVVDLDTDVGDVRLRRFVAVDDCGTILNPTLAEGQVHGGLLGGISQALFEEFRYDEDGNPLTATFADYAFPSAAEFPTFETDHTVTPTPNNPLGAKGIGEAGTTGSWAAVQNAVNDALRPFGIDHLDPPYTPARVWRAIHATTSPRN